MTSTLEIEVVDIRKINTDSKLKASASVKVGGGLIIRGFSILNGEKGIFVSFPKRPGKDGVWYETVSAVDERLGREIKDKVMEAYERETDGVQD